ncbi:hypothetical protein BSLG_008677 [Batrachochytrium salamandrivorans]|nr:hypothetical protein BSLG_008677 [Batrachochytrium salamandrivorans]
MRKQAGRILLLLLGVNILMLLFQIGEMGYMYLDSTPIRVIRNWLSVATSLSIGLMELEILSVFVVLTNIKIVMSMHFMIYARMVVIALHIIGDFTYLADKIWFDSDALPYDYRTKWESIGPGIILACIALCSAAQSLFIIHHVRRLLALKSSLNMGHSGATKTSSDQFPQLTRLNVRALMLLVIDFLAITTYIASFFSIGSTPAMKTAYRSSLRQVSYGLTGVHVYVETLLLYDIGQQIKKSSKANIRLNSTMTGGTMSTPNQVRNYADQTKV